MNRYYVELKNGVYFYLYAYSEEQVRDIVDSDIICIDLTNQEKVDEYVLIVDYGEKKDEADQPSERGSL